MSTEIEQACKELFVATKAQHDAAERYHTLLQDCSHVRPDGSSAMVTFQESADRVVTSCGHCGRES